MRNKQESDDSAVFFLIKNQMDYSWASLWMSCNINADVKSSSGHSLIEEQ